MKPFTKKLEKAFQEFEQRIPQVSSASQYKVNHAATKQELDDIIFLDQHEKNGFLEPNKLSPEELTLLWERDKHGFYIVYTCDKTPVGYCDIFGLDPQNSFLPN